MLCVHAVCKQWRTAEHKRCTIYTEGAHSSHIEGSLIESILTNKAKFVRTLYLGTIICTRHLTTLCNNMPLIMKERGSIGQNSWTMSHYTPLCCFIYCHIHADCTHTRNFLFLINSKGTKLHNYTQLRRKIKSLNNISKVREAADHSWIIPHKGWSELVYTPLMRKPGTPY